MRNGEQGARRERNRTPETCSEQRKQRLTTKDNASIELTAQELHLIEVFRKVPKSAKTISQIITPACSYALEQAAMQINQISNASWFLGRWLWLRHSRRRYGPVVASVAICLRFWKFVTDGDCFERGDDDGAASRRRRRRSSDDASEKRNERTTTNVLLRIGQKLTEAKPLPDFTGHFVLLVGAFAPHKALIRRFLKVCVRLCKIPKVRKALQKNGKKLAKLLAQNKAKNEVFSYRQALNEAWKELESSLAPDVLQSMRAAEKRAAAIAHKAFEDDDADALFASEDDEDDDEDKEKKKKQLISVVQKKRTMMMNNNNGLNLPERGRENNNKRNNNDNNSTPFPRKSLNSTKKANRWFDSPSDREDDDDDDIDDIIIETRVEEKSSTSKKMKNVIINNKYDDGFVKGGGGSPRKIRGNGLIANVQRSILNLAEDIRCFPQDAVDYVFLGDAGLPLAKLPRESDIERFVRVIDREAKDYFSHAQLACFLMQRQNKIEAAAEAVERSAKWRGGYTFLNDRALQKFEDVIFRHRRLPRGGAQVIFRLRAAHDMILKSASSKSSLNLEMVVCAIVSVVEREWQKLRASSNGRLRGGIVCVVDCAGLDITALPISLVAATLRLLDANYPELAAEVHVTSVWWAAKRALKALLDGVSTSSRARVHIYKSGYSGTEKLLDHFARHQLPSCIAGGTCKCRRCKSLPTAQMFRTREGTWRDIPWGEMSSSQRRQYVRHHFVYLIGLCAFYPMHFARMTAHPFLVSAVKLDSRMSRRTRIMVWRTVISAIVLIITFWMWSWMESNPTKVEIIKDEVSAKVLSIRDKGKQSVRELKEKAVLARGRFISRP